MNDDILMIRTVLGVRSRKGTIVSDRDGTLTEALIMQREEKDRKWRFWESIQLEGYEDPWRE